MAVTVIMKFRNTAGLPAKFEIAPSLDDVIQWDGEEYAAPGAYRVEATSFEFNALTNSYCPVLWLELADLEFRDQ